MRNSERDPDECYCVHCGEADELIAIIRDEDDLREALEHLFSTYDVLPCLCDQEFLTKHGILELEEKFHAG